MKFIRPLYRRRRPFPPPFIPSLPLKSVPPGPRPNPFILNIVEG